MANALDVAKHALALWRSNHGNASLDQQCQRYDGYYWQWAYQGNENIHTYGTATAAARASSMFTYNINDASISPGDLVYWDWGTDGHVGTVIGRQNGRTLVTHTSSRGDTVLSLTNNVKVSHADSIPLSFIGVSHTNGANIRRTGLSGWPSGGGALQPHERRVTSGGPANGRAQPTTASGVVQTIPGDDTGEFDGWINGESVSGNKVWYRGKFSKNWFWSGSFTETGTKGLTDLNPPAPTDPTKRVTNDIVRVRQEPNTSSATLLNYESGTTHTILGWKNGEAVEGIKEWFRTAEGWVWSDGFTNRSTTGLTDLNKEPTPDPDPEPTPDPGDFTPNIVTPSATDFPAWIRYEEKLKPGVTTQRNVEDAEYYGKKYNPGESHVHWWGAPGQSGTHDSNVSYLNGSKDLDANFVTSAGRVTLCVPLNIIAYTTGQRNPYGWKSENDPALTDLGYKTLGYVHYIVEKLNPKLLNEPIRLHQEFTATSCSDIDPAKVRDYAEKFRTGALDPATGEPPVTPGPGPQPDPDQGDLIAAIHRLSDKMDSLNAKLDSIYNL